MAIDQQGAPRVDEALAALELTDGEGRKEPLGALWRERPTVLLFVRHFGWLFCQEQAAAARSRMAGVKEKGAQLVVVGSGQPDQARDFGERSGLTAAGARLLVDPSLEAFRLAGMHRGLDLSLKLVGAAFRALRAGHMQGRTQGDAKQLGGVLVVGAGGAIKFRHANQSAGEMAPLDAALAAI